MKIMESNTCRLCFSNGGNQLMNIFSDIGMELKMDEIIREHFKSDIREADPLPNVVCQMCWSTTESFHELYEKSRVVQRKFLDALVKTETQTETEPDPIDVWQIDNKGTHDESCFVEEPYLHVETVKIEFIKEDSGSVADALMNYEDNCDDESVDIDYEKDPRCETSDVVEHLNRHLQPDNYKCLHCDKVLSSVNALDKHVERTHTDVRVQKSRKRPKEKEKSEEEVKVIAENFDMTCDQCDAVFTSLYEAQIHYKDIHNEPKGYVKCCGIKLKNKYRFRDHMKYHLDPESFKCDICGKIHTSQEMLRQHKYQHKRTMNKSFICDFCGNNFRDKEAIIRHLFSNHVTSEPKYECDICHKKFHLPWLLKNHHYSVHREKKRSATCEICGKSFHTKFHLDKHKRLHMDKSERLAQSQQCEHCGEWLMTKSGVFYHKQIHTSGVQTCKQCGMELANRNSLLAHIRTYHREHKFKCSFCEKTFATGSVKKKHEEKHTRHKVYECKFCPNTYALYSSFITHMKRKHGEEYKLSKEQEKMNNANA